MKDVGIVVLNYNNYELSIKCVDIVLSYNLGIEVVIVDNMSDNDSYKKLKDYYLKNCKVTVIQNKENLGYANGNNYGIKYLIDNNKDIKYFCIMNPDVEIIDRNIFNNLRNILKYNNDIACASGLMLIRNELKINNCFWDIPKGVEIATKASALAELKKQKLDDNEKGFQYVEVVPGSFFMIKKDVYEKINGFDEGTFLYNEEIIIAIKIKKIGMKNAISLECKYNHNHIKKTKTLIQKVKARHVSDKSRLFLCKKYYCKIYLPLLELVIISNYFVIVFRHIKQKLQLLFFK